jgi:hypothetical protein
MRSYVVKVKHLYKEMYIAQTTATFLIEESEFINDYTRSQSTIKYVQNTMAEMNKKVPTDWETHYVNALKTHRYLLYATKNNSYAPNEEQSGN